MMHHLATIAFEAGFKELITEVLPDWTRIFAEGSEIDLAAAVSGGYIVDTSDRFYGDARNMLMIARKTKACQ